MTSDPDGSLEALASDNECAESSDPDVCAWNAIQLHKAKLSTSELQHMNQTDHNRGEPGIVSEIYTFGAPGTTATPMEDLARPDKTFQGLRAYTEDVVADANHDDGGASWGQYAFRHPLVATAVLRWASDSVYVAPAGRPDWPVAGIADWGLHSEKNYVDRLKAVTVNGESYRDYGPFRKASLMVHLAFNAYEYTLGDMRRAVSEYLPGWTIVHYASQWTEEAKDNIWLVQDGSTLECAVVFTGTRIDEGLGELGTSIKDYKTGYCGHTGVHAGYRDKLYWLTKGQWPALRPKLSKCSRVVATGHSLGGSLADIFAGCANTGNVGDVDFQRQMWYKGKAERMPEFQFQE